MYAQIPLSGTYVQTFHSYICTYDIYVRTYPYICTSPTYVAPGVDTNAATYQIDITGRQGSVDLMATADADCNEGTETLTCQMGTVVALQLSGEWTVSITGTLYATCTVLMYVHTCMHIRTYA